MSTLLDFHFLRPGWLLALLPAAWTVFHLLRQGDPANAWKGVIAPHLLAALALEGSEPRSRLRPVMLLGAALALGILALAGPAWERQPAPFAEDQAAVFVVVKVTPSMLAEDVPPNRLERANQKLTDFLELRPGQRTGLVAYAGTAHLAMPLTSDSAIIETFAEALAPEAMPVAGDDPAAAIGLANQRLDRASVPGSIVLITDDIPEAAIEDLERQRSSGGAPVHILAVAGGPDVVPPVGSPPALPLNETRLRAAARAGGGTLTLLTPDPSDVEALASNVERGIRSVTDGERDQWRDMGYWLLPLLALLLLPFFRPGGATGLAP
ncbi:MAG: VWA domain-containing protein [Pseudomonadota bacterium]